MSSPQTRIFEPFKLILKGGVIGVANIIPGVSGGTMAVVLGIYEELIEAIGNFATRREKRRDYAVFLFKLALGAVTMVVSLSWLMDFLLTNYPQPTYLFFMGLIAGSIPSIYRGHNDMRPDIKSLASFAIGAALILSLALFFPDVEGSKNINFEYQITLSGMVLLLVGGVFAGGSMIVPGISGSFILVLLGQYSVVIKAIKEFNFVVLGVVAIGVLFGIWSFAKLIDISLKKFPKETFYFILALVFASLYPIFPGLPPAMAGMLLALGLAVLGAAIAYILGEKKS